MKKLSKLVFYFVIIFFLAISLRGSAGNIQKTDMDSSYWNQNGPFELSPERGRFALTYSLVEDGSFSFDLPVAKFALPDLGYIDGKYVSLFAPGISFLIIPGYMLGKFFGISQLGSFAIISLFAVLNALLIDAIARKLGAKRIYSALAALAFLFATPAFVYAVSLYQHHVSVFLFLAGVYVYLNVKRWFSVWIIWFLAALSISVDYPNFFMMIPLMILAVMKIFSLEETSDAFRVKFRFSGLMGILGIILPLTFLGWVNYESYSDPFRLAGTVMNVRSIDPQGLPGELLQEDNQVGLIEESGSSNTVALAFFNTRNISNGLYIHLFSPDRGIVVYAPIILFSIIGGLCLYKKNPKVLALLTGTALINLFVYSMWGDPWGGWAFGSRYLIPLYAIASIFLASGLGKVFSNKYFKLIFLLLLVYSVFVNTLGAITTSTNPPKIEAASLSQLSGKEEKYTFMRNWDHLKNYGSKSYFYGRFLDDVLTPTDFYLLLALTLSFFFSGLVFFDLYSERLVNRLPVLKKDIKTIDDVIVEKKGVPISGGRLGGILENYFSYFRNRRYLVWKD